MNWFWKLLGYHVCEDFTRWETVKGDFERLPHSMREKIIAGMVDRIEFSKRWQERTCKTCGKLHQRNVYP